jgi:DNA-binding PadR family transcriptional regulator
MSLKYVVLGLLTQSPRYGYELKREAERLLGGGAELNPGQLYPLLRKLAEQHLIAGERVEQEDRPDKRVFSLTEAGASDLRGWLAEPVNPQVGRSALFLQFVVLALVQPADLPGYLREQRRRLLASLGHLVDDRAKHALSDDLATRALREATILHAEADLKWVEWLESLQEPADANQTKRREP